MAKTMADLTVPAFVDASPTKQFFISVLIKDIEFIDALVELIDNSVDAVRAKYPGNSLKNGLVRVSFGPKEICVVDNGEGISIDQARNNAFRFGRSKTSKVNASSVGAFGVGMKRALFKLGKHFRVTSRTSNDQFRVEVSVDTWERTEEKTEWRFPMTEELSGLSNKNTGTDIAITKLHEYSIEETRSTTFGVRFRDRLEAAHELALSQGLKIVVNDVPLAATSPALRRSAKLQPIHIEDTIKVSGSEVSVRLYAGVGEEEKLTDAGWYVFCNGRQIERAEKTRRTGWDSALEGGAQTPRPHWQFRRFRGYIFFDSVDSLVLPWNTMKTGLNVEAATYRRVLPQLTMALRDVISFLNAVDSEEDDNGPLHASIDGAKPVQLKKLPLNATFTFPSGKGSSASMTTISCRKDSELVARVKEELGVKKNPEVAEGVFDYYVKAKRLQ